MMPDDGGRPAEDVEALSRLIEDNELVTDGLDEKSTALRTRSHDGPSLSGGHGRVGMAYPSISAGGGYHGARPWRCQGLHIGIPTPPPNLTRVGVGMSRCTEEPVEEIREFARLLDHRVLARRSVDGAPSVRRRAALVSNVVSGFTPDRSLALGSSVLQTVALPFGGTGDT